MTYNTELYGIDEKTFEKLVEEMEKELEGQKKKESVIRLVNKWSTEKRDQREIVVLSFMLGAIAAK